MPKLCALSLVTSITLLSATPNNQGLHRVIEKKIVDRGVLAFTQKEISKSLLVGLIDKQKSFTLTHLANRDEVVEDIEKNLEDTQQKFQVKNGQTKAVKGVIGYFLGGATGAFLGYFSDFTKDDTQWLIPMIHEFWMLFLSKI